MKTTPSGRAATSREEARADETSLRDIPDPERAERARIRELGLVEKPAKKKRLWLSRTCKVEQVPVQMNRTKLTIWLPAWAVVRGSDLCQPNPLQAWLHNARWIDDPVHGEFTRARFISMWESVMKTSPHWVNRDRRSNMEVVWYLSAETQENIRIISEFLKIDEEVILVGIICSEVLARTPVTAPYWNDIEMLKAYAGGEA